MARVVVCLSVVCYGCIVAKRCEIGLKVLLITNRKSHIALQMTWNILILDDLKGQYCNRNCTGCSAFPLAIAGLSCNIRYGLRCSDCAEPSTPNCYNCESASLLLPSYILDGQSHHVCYLVLGTQPPTIGCQLSLQNLPASSSSVSMDTPSAWASALPNACQTTYRCKSCLWYTLTRSPAVAGVADLTGCQWSWRSSKVDDFHFVWKGVFHFLS